MSTTFGVTALGLVLFALGVGAQGMKDAGCGGGVMGFLGTLGLSGLYVAGFRKGYDKGEELAAMPPAAVERAKPSARMGRSVPGSQDVAVRNDGRKTPGVPAGGSASGVGDVPDAGDRGRIGVEAPGALEAGIGRVQAGAG